MNPYAFLVPRLWSAEQALAAVVLLRRFIDAIWEVHGEQMALEVLDQPERWALEDVLDHIEDLDEPDDPADLPF